ncbi:MAG: hypothetical protein F4X02_16105 [Chloroflexi bacterium]|nr:hypothetical protein [Chloroflexota bacterium]
MRHLGNIAKAARLLVAARDLAVESQRFRWEVAIPSTLFLQAEQSDIRLAFHDQPQILATAELRAGFGWQLTTDQDAAGVYVVALRKPVIGSIARGKFTFHCPRGIYLSLKLQQCRLRFDDMTATLDLPPFLLET